MGYILKIKKINLDPESIEMLLENCGDSIGNIENEIEKMILGEANSTKIEIKNLIISRNIKDYPIWKLMDSLGKKDLTQSYKIYNSLWMNNISLSQIIFNLNNLFQGIFWSLLREKNNNQYGLNYFIQKNMIIYSNQYNLSEVKQILSDLRAMDYKVKSISLSEKELMIPFLIKTCKGINESV